MKRLKYSSIIVLLILSSSICFSQQDTTLIKSGDIWKYTFGFDINWFNNSYDDTFWSIGITPFGNPEAQGHYFNYITEWPVYSTLYCRREFFLPNNLQELRIRIAIDNDIVIYINNVYVDSISSGGFAYQWEYTVSIPDSILNFEQNNYICIKAIDWGVGTGFDLELVGDIITGFHSILNSNIPNEWYLNQNYPNPFNPTTKIKYSIPQQSKVVIKVFDILGNEIETLVNEEKQTGTYEITCYAEGLPSGVYFYRIQAGDFVDTKKMVLLK